MPIGIVASGQTGRKSGCTKSPGASRFQVFELPHTDAVLSAELPYHLLLTRAVECDRAGMPRS